MNLVFGSLCPLHEGNKHCPCRFALSSLSKDAEDMQRVDVNPGLPGFEDDFAMSVPGRLPTVSCALL